MHSSSWTDTGQSTFEIYILTTIIDLMFYLELMSRVTMCLTSTHSMTALGSWRDISRCSLSHLQRDRSVRRHSSGPGEEFLSIKFQVDMKIMYYELIRMLIDYERKNHPQTYDATKTVGKIEGYQELTNKLQRYNLHVYYLKIKH